MKTCCIRLCLLLGWLLPLMAGCSKEEVWTPFGVGEYGSYSMLPDHEVYELEIKVELRLIGWRLQSRRWWMLLCTRMRVAAGCCVWKHGEKKAVVAWLR